MSRILLKSPKLLSSFGSFGSAAPSIAPPGQERSLRTRGQPAHRGNAKPPRTDLQLPRYADPSQMTYSHFVGQVRSLNPGDAVRLQSPAQIDSALRLTFVEAIYRMRVPNAKSSSSQSYFAKSDGAEWKRLLNEGKEYWKAESEAKQREKK